MMPRQSLTVTIISPEVKGHPPLKWLTELGGISRIAGVDMKLVGGPTCTREEIAESFETPRDVFILSGHGLPGGVAAPNHEGGIDLLQPKWLAMHVKCAAPRLFVLAACNSLTKDVNMRSMAEPISLKGVNVIGYTVEAQDDAAIIFNIELIRALARGADIGDAVGVAVEAIQEHYPETAGGLFLLPGLTNGLGEIRQRLDRLEEAVYDIQAKVSQNGTAPKRPRVAPKPAGC